MSVDAREKLHQLQLPFLAAKKFNPHYKSVLSLTFFPEEPRARGPETNATMELSNREARKFIPRNIGALPL